MMVRWQIDPIDLAFYNPLLQSHTQRCYLRTAGFLGFFTSLAPAFADVYASGSMPRLCSECQLNQTQEDAPIGSGEPSDDANGASGAPLLSSPNQLAIGTEGGRPQVVNSFGRATATVAILPEMPAHCWCLRRRFRAPSIAHWHAQGR